MSNSERPQKGARKLVIDGETWWWKHSHYLIPIWDPSGKKHMHDVKTEGRAITPFDIRVHIDRHIRKRPKAEVDAVIAHRRERIKKERSEYISTLRQVVLARAKTLVAHSDQLMGEYYGDDDITENNELQNETFIRNLLTVLAFDTAEDMEG